MIDDLQSRLRSAVAKQFGMAPPEVTANLKMGDHPAWDSMGHMGLVAALEKEFAVRFPSHALPRITSVALIEKELSKMLSKV
jgi:acyl carrier protein